MCSVVSGSLRCRGERKMGLWFKDGIVVLHGYEVCGVLVPLSMTF